MRVQQLCQPNSLPRDRDYECNVDCSLSELQPSGRGDITHPQPDVEPLLRPGQSHRRQSNYKRSGTRPNSTQESHYSGSKAATEHACNGCSNVAVWTREPKKTPKDARKRQKIAASTKQTHEAKRLDETREKTSHLKPREGCSCAATRERTKRHAGTPKTTRRQEVVAEWNIQVSEGGQSGETTQTGHCDKGEHTRPLNED